MTTPFIAIEGIIGIGKTSLAKAVSQAFSFTLLREIVEENPFLDKFYDNIDEWSFQTEMFFLCNRYKQLQDIEKNYLHKQIPVVSDYHVFKNVLFAKRTLQPTELEKYLKIYQILTMDMPTPNLVVYLHASMDTVLSRIQMRGREFEKTIDVTYLEQLSADYAVYMKEFIALHPDIPVVEINGDELDFVSHQKDLHYIIGQIERYISKENHYELSGKV